MYKLVDEVTENWSVVLKLRDTLQRISEFGNPFYKIVQLLEDKDKGKLYVFHEEGVHCFEEKTGLLEKEFRNGFFKSLDAPLRSTLDKAGIVWFSGSSTLLSFDVNTGQLTHATVFEKALSRNLQSAYSTFIDRSGLLWIGTAGYGILKRNTRSELFHHIGNSSNYSIKE